MVPMVYRTSELTLSTFWRWDTAKTSRSGVASAASMARRVAGRPAPIGAVTPGKQHDLAQRQDRQRQTFTHLDYSFQFPSREWQPKLQNRGPRCTHRATLETAQTLPINSLRHGPGSPIGPIGTSWQVPSRAGVFAAKMASPEPVRPPDCRVAAWAAPVQIVCHVGCISRQHGSFRARRSGASLAVTGPADKPLATRLGAALGDAYTIEGEIGRGGMGVVYRARDERLQRRVAIKVLPPELAFQQEIRERFTREAQTAARLSHPHIVPIHTVGEGRGWSTSSWDTWTASRSAPASAGEESCRSKRPAAS